MTIEYKDSKRIIGLSYSSTQQDLTTGTTDAGTNSTIRGFGNQIKSAHAIVGSTLTKVEVSFKTSMTGTATVGVWDSSNNLKLTLGTKDLSTLTGSEVYYTFDTGSVIMEANWIIGFQISGTATNTSVTLRTNGTNADPNIDAYNYNSSSGWGLDGTTREYNMKIHYNNGGDEKPISVQNNSIMVEKDTGKRYWFDAESESSGNITWSTTGKVGYNISGTTISRTGSAGWGTSKIQSTDTFTVGNGKFMIEFSGIGNDQGSTMLGFNKGTLGYYIGSPQNQADYSIYLAGGSLVEVYESGSKEYDSGGTRTNGSDRYRIEIDNDGLVKYYYQSGGTGSWVKKHETTGASGTYFIQANSYSASSVATVHSKTITNPAAWTYPPEGIDSSGQIAQLSGSNAANSYTAASEFYTISTDTWDSAFNVSGGARARAGSAGSTEHAYLMGGQDGSGYFGTIDKVAWADKTNTTISRSTRAWGGAVQNAVSVCVGQSYYYGSYQTGINEYTYGTMAETSQGNTSSSHAFGGSFGNSTYGFVINGQNTGIERYTYSDKSKTASGFTASPTTTNAGGHTGNSTTGISINNTAGSGNARYDAYNISADTWTTGSATSSTPYEAGRASGSSTWNLWSTQTNTSSARQCEKYNYSSGALSSFTSVATNLDGGDQDAGASSINTGVNS